MKKFYQISVLCLLFWASNALIAQNLPVLVKDINPNNEVGSNPFALCAHKTYLYFSANDGDGRGIYRTDGTVAGTVLLRDNIETFKFFPGVNYIYFISTTNADFNDLFKINTQTLQVTKVKNFEYAVYDKGYVWGDQFYFYADTSTNDSDMELWVSDGTTAGTHKVKDINPTSHAIHYNYCKTPVLLNNKLYFSADDGVHGLELWSTDGTEAGTQMVKDIFLGSESSMYNFGEMEVLNGQLYFVAYDNTTGSELWKSNGTASGTVRVKDINVGSDSGFSNYTSHYIEKVSFGIQSNQTKLVFAADDGSHGTELWVSNGTESGTYMLKDINNGTNSSTSHLGASYLFKYYFVADDGVHGKELWKTNGTAEGTVMVKDLFPGGEGSGISNLVFYHGQLYLTATSNGFSYHLYRTDGTEAGTQIVLPASFSQGNPAPEYLTDAGGRALYYSADYHVPEGRELYKLAIPYHISTAAEPASGGAAFGAGDYLVGDQVTLTAMPVANYEFVHWTNSSGSVVSTSATYIFTMPSFDRTYTAHFQSTIGIEDEEILGIKIYPNPADSQLFIDGINEPTTLSIFNLTGAKVMEILLDKNRSLDINHLNTGMYIGIFENSQGKNPFKFVKE